MERVKTSRPTIGTDEVGRGCLAGPVCAAAVLEPTERFDWWSEIRDSKKLSAKKRHELSQLIVKNCVYGLELVHVPVIDDINILNASLLAMRTAVEEAYREAGKPDNTLILVDGNRPLQDLPPFLDQECIKGGDDIVKCIGAASIVAKDFRDRVMCEHHKDNPNYGWDRNKGYGTEEHREAIMVHGVTPLHRRTFRGVTEYV